MTYQLAFWLLVVLGLLAYSIFARSSPDEVETRRHVYEESQRTKRAADRGHVVPRGKAASRTTTAARSRATTPRRRTSERKRPRRRGIKWPFAWPGSNKP